MQTATLQTKSDEMLMAMLKLIQERESTKGLTPELRASRAAILDEYERRFGEDAVDSLMDKMGL